VVAAVPTAVAEFGDVVLRAVDGGVAVAAERGSLEVELWLLTLLGDADVGVRPRSQDEEEREGFVEILLN
jgi:hypothetical protein